MAWAPSSFRRVSSFRSLRTGLLLLLLPESEQTNTRNLDDLETNTGNITLGLTLTTETGEENLVVLVDEVQTTVIGDCMRFPLVSDLFLGCPVRLEPRSSCQDRESISSTFPLLFLLSFILTRDPSQIHKKPG